MTAITGKPQPVPANTISDLVDEKPFHPDLDRLEFRSMLGTPYVLTDGVIRQFKGKNGPHPGALLRVENIERNEAYTTICSGEVVVERVRRWLSSRKPPVVITPVEVQVQDSDNRYYSLV